MNIWMETDENNNGKLHDAQGRERTVCGIGHNEAKFLNPEHVRDTLAGMSLGEIRQMTGKLFLFKGVGPDFKEILVTEASHE